MQSIPNHERRGGEGAILDWTTCTVNDALCVTSLRYEKGLYLFVDHPFEGPFEGGSWVTQVFRSPEQTQGAWARETGRTIGMDILRAVA